MAKKYLGQNFLFDPSILKKIIKASDLSPEDTVIDIGAGHGRLTEMLANTVKKVIALEIDKAFYAKLKNNLAHLANVEIVHCDALKYPYDMLAAFKVVGNIPYYITTPIIFRLLEERHHLKSMTFTVQKEVARRIAASPDCKEYGVLSLMIQYFGKPDIKFSIPRGAFRPVPKVDSALLHILIYKKPLVHVANEDLFFRLIKTAFSQRRKTLANSLQTISSEIKTELASTGLDPSRRAGTLSIEEFARLANLLNNSLAGKICLLD